MYELLKVKPFTSHRSKILSIISISGISYFEEEKKKSPLGNDYEKGKKTTIVPTLGQPTLNFKGYLPVIKTSLIKLDYSQNEAAYNKQHFGIDQIQNYHQ